MASKPIFSLDPRTLRAYLLYHPFTFLVHFHSLIVLSKVFTFVAFVLGQSTGLKSSKYYVLSFPLARRFSLVLSIIDDYGVKGEQLSEETTSMERTQTQPAMTVRRPEVPGPARTRSRIAKAAQIYCRSSIYFRMMYDKTRRLLQY